MMLLTVGGGGAALLLNRRAKDDVDEAADKGKSDLQDLWSKYTDVLESRAKVQDDFDDYKTQQAQQVEGLKTTIGQYRDQLIEVQAEVRLMKEAHEKQRSEWYERNKILIEEKVASETQLNVRLGELERKVADYEAIKKERDRLLRENTALVDREDQLNREVKSLRTEKAALESYKRQAERLNTECEDCRAELSDARNQIAELKGDAVE